jgi:hypothetical protein
LKKDSTNFAAAVDAPIAAVFQAVRLRRRTTEQRCWAMPRCVEGFFNPESWQRAAGGPSRAETPGKQSVGSVHPEVIPEFCDPFRVGWRSLDRRSGGVAPAFAPLRRGKSLDPRLFSGKPSACADGVTKPNFRCSGRADAIVCAFLRHWRRATEYLCSAAEATGGRA